MNGKSTTSQSGFFGSRTPLAVLLCIGIAFLVAAAASPATAGKFAFLRREALSKTSQRTLSFAERVSYQRAIEEVYWRHRIWPKENPYPEPSLDALMTQAQLEKKVTEYLRNSQALEDYWDGPLTAEQLQGETNRMAEYTKQPQVLRELFAALGNDPFVIAECLARPLLADRLLTQSPSDQVKQTSRTYKRTIAATGDYRLPSVSDDGGCTDDTWAATAIAPFKRADHTAVWTGSEMIVWGGVDNVVGYSNSGGRYYPSTDSWTATSLTNAPDRRVGHPAVWTGSEMIVWGGFGSNFVPLNTGGRYNPSTDTWRATSTSNAPTARDGPTAVWTGSEMIVWGGYGAGRTGGRYNPNTDSWTATSTSDAPGPRSGHTAVWTGSEMIVWGGDFPNFSNTGGRYNPSTDSWVPTSRTNAPTSRGFPTAAWTGSEMIVWGGYFSDGTFQYLNTGGRYNPSTDSWTATSTNNAPTGRYAHTAVWTGSKMIVWGGDNGITGGRYNPSTDSWTATSTTNAPHGRRGHTAVWTGSEMIVWGGYFFDGSTHYLNTGGRYCATGLPAQLGNISTRAFVQTGDDVMIGGFIVQGAEPKRVIIRAIGPELAQHGIPNPLLNPTLELHDGRGALIASNDDWHRTIIGGIITSDQWVDIINSGHAPRDGRESAIIVELPPGNYTAIVRGVNDTTGVALVEVYDLNPDTNSILGNISTRSFVQTDDNVMIGGFIVQGTQPKRVILRAIGPELSQFGVPNPLPDPVLELHNRAGTLIASNDDWQHTIIGGIITSDQVRDIRSSGHAPKDGRESAIIADLPPGNYTGIVRGKNIITGGALVEVYDLD
jgi:N-acetylneuraminic acid mutarotase